MKESGCYRGHFQGKGFSQRTGSKRRLAKEHEHLKDFRRDSLNSVFYTQEYDLLVLEDLNVQDLIQKSENKKRKLRLYDFSFSELCLSGSFEKEKNLFYLFQRTTLHASVFCAGKSTRILKESLTAPTVVLLLTATSTLVLKRGGSHPW